jgi:hypothetical protein
VELDARNVKAATAIAPDGVEVVQADAGSTDACIGATPTDLLVLCGIFGNVADTDVEPATGTKAQQPDWPFGRPVQSSDNLRPHSTQAL